MTQTVTGDAPDQEKIEWPAADRPAVGRLASLEAPQGVGPILVALGVFYNNGLFRMGLGEMRYPSVLGRIGLA